MGHYDEQIESWDDPCKIHGYSPHMRCPDCKEESKIKREERRALVKAALKDAGLGHIDVDVW